MKPLKDKYNRQINYLRISVTDRCNFRCRHCMPSEGITLLPREEILSYEEIIKVIDVALRLGITNFRITGGEPLIRTDIIDFLNQLIKTPRVESVSLTTNGFLLKEYFQSLKDIGLHNINIGINSLAEDNFTKFTGINGLQKVKQGIEALLQAGFSAKSQWSSGSGGQHIKINTVIIRGFNDTELLNLARLTFEYPIYLRFIEYMPCGKWNDDSFGLTVPAEEIMAHIRTLGELSPINKIIGHGPAQYYQCKGAQGLIGFIAPISQPFCSQCNRLRLTADGQLKSCLLSMDTIDLKPILRTFPVPLDELENAFFQAAALKPKTHCREKLTPMSRIGG